MLNESMLTVNPLTKKTTSNVWNIKSAKHAQHHFNPTKDSTYKTKIIQFHPKQPSKKSSAARGRLDCRQHNHQNYIQLRDICQLFDNDKIKRKITAAAQTVIAGL